MLGYGQRNEQSTEPQCLLLSLLPYVTTIKDNQTSQNNVKAQLPVQIQLPLHLLPKSNSKLANKARAKECRALEGGKAAVKRKRVGWLRTEDGRNYSVAGHPTCPHSTEGRRDVWHSPTPNLARKGSPEESFLPWRVQASTTTSKTDQHVLWEMASFPTDRRLPWAVTGHCCLWAAPVRGTLPQKEVRSLRKLLCLHEPETPISHQEGNQVAPASTAPLQRWPVQLTVSV